MTRRSQEQEALETLTYDTISLNSLGVHLFFGDIDALKAMDACDFILKSNLLASDHSHLTLFLNTVGGDCAEGFAVIDLMETSRLPVATVGVGQIMSMGVLLLSAGRKGYRTITKNVEVMAHQFAGYFYGKQHELVATQAAYSMLEQRFIRHFLRHSKMNEKQVRDVLFSPSDRYLTPEELKRYGLVDHVVEHAEPVTPAQLVKKKRSGSR